MLTTALSIGLGLLVPSVGNLQSPVPVRYALRGGEQLEHIAERYGVTVAALRESNPGKLKRGRVLAVDATRLPTPLQKHRTKSREDDTWVDIAERHEVTVEDIRRWNPRAGRRDRPRKGTPLVLWIPSGARHYPLPPDSSGFPPIERPASGESIGRPSRGRIEGAAKLPEGPYTIRFNWQSFGTALAVWNIQRAIGAFRAETGYERELLIGAMSRRSGRRLRPHRSHQSGRDVDIRLPAMPFAKTYKLSKAEVDWHAGWALIDAFVRTDSIRMIFLERNLRQRLRLAGMAMGADDERITRVMRKIRHAPGHTAHFHVRFVCDPDSTRCKDE